MTKIWTVGHSNRSLVEFLDLIRRYQVEAVADVRRFPGSRRHPHFHEHSLAAELRRIGVEYHAFRDLGGRRKRRPNSPNTAWRVAGFQGYADYMETDAFRVAIERLLGLAVGKRTAIMCAEALWWRCHRSLIADYLKGSGVLVNHVLTATKADPHPYTKAARIVKGKLSYAAAPEESLFE